MKFVRSTIGYMLAGMLVMSIWGGVLNGEFGTLGGILAGFFIIGLAWFVNHFLGLIHHAPTSGFIDLGLGVGNNYSINRCTSNISFSCCWWCNRWYHRSNR